MKLDQKRISLLGIIIVVIFFVIKTYQVSYFPESDFYNRTYRLQKSQMDLLNDSLQIAKQNLNRIENERRKHIDGDIYYSWSMFDAIGYAKTESADGIFGTQGQTFLIIKSVKLNLYDMVSKSYLQYYTKDGNGYLSRLKFIEKNRVDSVVYIDQKVDFGYLSRADVVLIPVHSTIGKIITPLCGIIVICFEIFLYLYVVRKFIVFLLAISRNEAFHIDNVNRLRQISLALLLMVFFPFLLEGITYLIFVLNYGSDGILFSSSLWDRGSYLVVGAIIIYLIYLAFKRGMELQEERDLTI